MSYNINLRLDPNFTPMIKVYQDYLKRADFNQIMTIGLESHNQVSYHELPLIPEYNKKDLRFIERYIKTLLWVKGGHTIFLDAPKVVGNYIKQAFSLEGERGFDVDFMETVYKRTFQVILTQKHTFPSEKSQPESIGRNLDGCRIGFDAGGSDRKVSAVKDGEVVYSEEVVWFPKLQSDPNYHLEEIKAAFQTAASHLPRVDAIGISSAGVYIDNQTRVASLFIKVPKKDYHLVENIYHEAVQSIGDVPFVVANDGDVTALAGAMGMNKNGILGIAMGTSEAVGYVNQDGHITGWLNELAFAPIDFNQESMVDEWSGDYGCGVKYLSQDSVIKLATAAKLPIDEKLSLADQLKQVQGWVNEGNEDALEIFRTIGVYLGYAILYYHLFYDINSVMILGRVTSGVGGDLILENARKIVELENPVFAESLEINLPNEQTRRVGQSIAAASLPVII